MLIEKENCKEKMMCSTMMIKGKSLSELTKALELYVGGVVSILAKEYGFEEAAGLKLLGELRVQKEGKSRVVKAKRVVPEILLPFCGVVEVEWCKAVRYNHGLFSQCTNSCKGEKFCKTCVKSLSEDGVPTHGLIEERGNEGWRSPKGKSPVNYGNIISKIEVSKEKAIAEAEKLGWIIGEEHFEVVKARKGRPTKNPKEADEKPKRRGRPKKSKPVVDGAGTGDDLIAQLVQQAQEENEVVVSQEDELAALAQETEDEASEDEAVEEKATDDEAVEEKATDEEASEDEAVEEKASEEESSEDEGAENEKKPKKTRVLPPGWVGKPKKETHKKKTTEEKEAEKLAKAEAKAKAAAEKKASKEAEKEAEKLAKAEAKAKAAAEKKASKEAEKEAEKLAKAEAKAKAAAEKKASKEAEKKAKAEDMKSSKKVEVEKEPTPDEELSEEEALQFKEELDELTIEDPVEEEVEDDAVEVIKFSHEDVEYLRDADGTVYDMENQEEIGEWDNETKTLTLI